MQPILTEAMKFLADKLEYMCNDNKIKILNPLTQQSMKLTVCCVLSSTN